MTTIALSRPFARVLARVDGFLSMLLPGEMMGLIILLAVVAGRVIDGAVDDWSVALWVAGLVATHELAVMARNIIRTKKPKRE